MPKKQNTTSTKTTVKPHIEKAYFEILFDKVPEAIVIADNSGKVLQINCEFTKIFGYTPKEAVGADLDRLVAPPSLAGEANRISRMVESGKTFSLETFRQKKSGEVFHVSMIGSPIVSDGKQVASFGIYRDISDRKTADEAFQREKAYLEQLIESAPEAIVLTENDGQVLRVNSEFEKMFGYTAKEAVGQLIDDLVAPAGYRQEASRITQTVAQGEKFALETVRRRKDRSLLYVSLVGSPIVIGGQQVAVYAIYRDISDRKKAEEAFQREKSYLEQLIESAPEAIVLAENNGKILRVNGEFEKMFGYSAKEAAGRLIDDLVAPAGYRQEATSVTQTVSQGEKFSLETLRRRKDGSLLHVSLVGSPIVIGGQQVAVYGIYRDISDRKKAEEAFQREKAYLEQLIESAPEAIVLAENNGRVLRVNSEFEKMFGYSAKEAAGRMVDDLVAPPKYMQEATTVTQTVSQGEKFSLETVRRRKDGSLFHVSLVGSPIIIGKEQVAVYAIYRDISDRKKAEEAFQLEKSYLEQLIETAAEGIVVLDKKGCITRANNEFSRMFGYAEQEAVGRSIDDLIIPSHLREEGLTLTGTAVGGSKFAAETVRQRKDGTLIHVSIIGSPIIIKGEQAAVYGIYRDISDRKKAEEAFQREKAYLEQLIESAPEAIVLAENDGRVLRVNSEFEKMFGYSAEETTGRLIDDLVAPVGYQEEATSVTHTVSQGEKFSLETVRRRKDGSQLHVSLVGSPIIIDGEQVAVYGIYRDISDRKKAEDELLENRTLLLKTNQSLQQRTRQLEEANSMLEQLSNLDGLTGIPNRRYFEHFFDIEWRRVRREKKWMSVIMIDVDFFKNYNDLHGHLAGDECLKKIANALQVAHRAGDLVARYGGEEFVMVLPNTDRNGALHLAEMMRTRVKDLMIPHGSSKINPCVTISLGIAAHIPDMSTDQLNLLMNADAALYNAKMNGRDRVEMYS